MPDADRPTHRDADCERVGALMEGALDNSVLPQTTAFLRRHIASCAACQARWELTAAWHRLAQDSLVSEVPPELAERLRRRLRGADGDA